MRLAVPSLVLFTYIFASLIAFMPGRAPIKVAAAFVLLVISLKYFIYVRIGGSFIAPDLPGPLLLTFEILYGSMVILAFLLLLKDTMALLLWLSRCLGTSWHLPFTPTIRNGGLILTALILGTYGTWQSLRVPDVRTVEIPLAKLPAGLDGLTIVQLSDIHIGPLLKRGWLEKVVEKTNSLAPDIIALTGDMVDDSPEALKDDISPLGKLRARYGVYGVTGNHEYYFHVERWLPVLGDLGVVMLHNEHRVLHANGESLVLAGLPDHAERRFGGPGPDIVKAMGDAPDAVRVLLAHQPGGALKNTGADLQLSGHTHGGLLFFLKWLLATFNGGLVGGLYTVDSMQLYVSPGTGLWSGFSCRLGVPSEISRIVLRAAGG